MLWRHSSPGLEVYLAHIQQRINLDAAFLQTIIFKTIPFQNIFKLSYIALCFCFGSIHRSLETEYSLVKELSSFPSYKSLYWSSTINIQTYWLLLLMTNPFLKLYLLLPYSLILFLAWQTSFCENLPTLSPSLY